MAESTHTRPLRETWPVTLVGASLLASAWVPRLLAGVERGFGGTLRGFGADLAAVLVILPVFLLLAPRGRIAGLLRGLLAAAWVLVHWAAFEHVRALDAPLALHQIGYLGDADFLRGSALSVSRPWILLGLMVVTVAGASLPRTRTRLRMVGLVFAAGLLGCVLSWLTLPSDGGRAGWRGQSVVGAAWRSLSEGDLSWGNLSGGDLFGGNLFERNGAATSADEALALALPADLSGAAWAEPAPEGRSVIVLVLEGVSGAYLPTIRRAAGSADPGIDLPRLDALARTSPAAVRMVSQQRQTNRGLWALLCGRLPRARATTSYLSDVAFSGRPPRPPCLPAVLAEGGRRTVFFQAAPLGFMQKDLAMPLLGFGEVREYADVATEGAADSEPFARSGWGVDDKTFLRQVRREVRRLRREDEPYFLTVLTAGTHHPYAVPGEPSLENAMAFLDEAAGELFEGLAADGVLDDTLVVVTSDESAGAVGSSADGDGVDARELLQSHGLLLVTGAIDPLRPDSPASDDPPRIRHPVVQSDLPLSLLDHLGLLETGEPPRFGGRSLFRHYPDDRAIPFANAYLRRASVYLPGEAAIVSCDDTGGSCRRQATDPDLFRLRAGAREEGAPPPLLRRWLRLGEEVVMAPGTVVPLRAERRGAVAEEPAGTLLFAGQYFDLPAGVALVVDLAGTVEGGETAEGDEGSWVHLRHDLRSDEMQESPVRFPVLAPGDSFDLRYRLLPPEDLHALSVRAVASRVAGGPVTLRLDRAVLRFEEKPADAPDGPVEILRWEVDRRREPPTLRERWTHLKAQAPAEETPEKAVQETVETVETADCVEALPRGGWRMEGCETGEILTGPRRYVASGSRLVARWRVRVETGSVAVRAVAGSRRPPIAFARTRPLELTAGTSRDLVLRTAVEPTLNHVVLALFLADASPDARWVVEEAEVAIVPP